MTTTKTRHNQFRRAISNGELLIAIAVLVVFAAIVIPIFLRAKDKTMQDGDARNLRQLYAAWSMYEADQFGAFAPDLAALRYRLPDDGALVSQLDPFRTDGGTGLYPMEPFLPDRERTSPVRISYAYFGNFIRAGELPMIEPQAFMRNPASRVLVSPWQGDCKPAGTEFKLSCRGAALKVRADGSLETTSIENVTPSELFQ